ncbi:MAG: hypothetical protein ACW9W4_01210 [Candidatus Nitrosopumilus sp. bin_7KS]
MAIGIHGTVKLGVRKNFILSLVKNNGRENRDRNLMDIEINFFSCFEYFGFG